ncbi:hypothetical protein DP115_19650 [Brasilonema octagenarum UFV-OR1]|uniref:Uncharacterized protein n=1 Tax=Brasilonema octagenarum UFV-OR1 TaxID=417115 RepID=A0ABX1M8H4_9CYAN|nr:hypothetical protein [Brasilonema octagenarum UFV-OR1]
MDKLSLVVGSVKRSSAVGNRSGVANLLFHKTAVCFFQSGSEGAILTKAALLGSDLLTHSPLFIA